MTPRMETISFEYTLGPQGAADRARLALGNNVVRGLVELITNSDTAYDHQQLSIDRRRITIEYSSKERWVAVRDQAGGMSPDIASKKFTQGGDQSAVGGRGYFGVGAKDCAVFGKLIVETVDESGEFTKITIPREYRNAKIGSRSAQQQDRDRLFSGRKRSGTVVTIKLASRAEGGPRLPVFKNIEDQLTKHFALRHLLERNNVLLIDRSRPDSSSRNKRLRYWHAPWEGPGATQCFDGKLAIDTYPESSPHLRLYDVGDAVSAQERNDQFEGFILIRTHAADHGYFLAGLEHHPYASRLAGEMVDPYIQTLLDGFREEGATERNDRPVIRQDRQPQNGGLDTNHPYYSKLASAIRPHVEHALEDITVRLQEAERAGISAKLQQANLEAGSWLGNYLEEDSGGTPQLPDGFYFLPTSARVGPGGTKPMTIYNVGVDTLSDGFLNVTSDDNNLVAIESVTDFSEPALPQSGSSPRQRASITIKAGVNLGSATLTAEYEREGYESLSVDGEVSIVADPPPVQEFRFEHSAYGIRPDAQKFVRVLIPFEMADNHMTEPVRFSVEADEDSIATVGPVTLAIADGYEDPQKEAHVLSFRIEARGGFGSAGRIYARLSDQEASATVRSRGTSIPVFDDDNESSPPDSRAVVYESGLCPGPATHQGGPCLHFFLRHRDVEKWLGEAIETSAGNPEWNLIDTHGFRAMKADAIAEAAAQYRVLRLNQIREASTGDPVTPDEVLRLLWQEKRRALPQMQRIYIESLPIMWSSQPH